MQLKFELNWELWGYLEWSLIQSLQLSVIQPPFNRGVDPSTGASCLKGTLHLTGLKELSLGLGNISDQAFRLIQQDSWPQVTLEQMIY